MCFCAVCSRVAPWTEPAHCVHLLCCRCSGCLQHHRYSHPEIVSPITHTYTHWLNVTQAIKKFDRFARYLEVDLAKLWLSWLAAREFQDAIAHAAVVLSVCEPILSECACFPMKSWSSAFLLSLLDPSARLLSPQEIMSVGDKAVSVCFVASLKPAFSLIQLNCKFPLFTHLLLCQPVYCSWGHVM